MAERTAGNLADERISVELPGADKVGGVPRVIPGKAEKCLTRFNFTQ